MCICDGRCVLWPDLIYARDLSIYYLVYVYVCTKYNVGYSSSSSRPRLQQEYFSLYYYVYVCVCNNSMLVRAISHTLVKEKTIIYEVERNVQVHTESIRYKILVISDIIVACEVRVCVVRDLQGSEGLDYRLQM